VDLEDAATKLSVHYQTAYRWVRDGLLPAVKVGAEYDVDPADVAHLAAMRSAPTGDGVDKISDQRIRELATALTQGEERTARSLVVAAHQSDGGPMAACDGLILPAFQLVEARHEAGSLSGAERLLALGICERLVGLLASPGRGRPRGMAVVAGPEAGGQRLPGLLATVALRSDHWRVHDLGPSVPAPDIVEFAADRCPAVIVLAAPSGFRGTGDLHATIEGATAAPVLWYEPDTPLGELAIRVRRLTGLSGNALTHF
jgi:MerR family transcriptional regulator, light-induced transcriptional regulator